ncbi:hypothetical protein [Actinopolyspora halophila]|uniref:hypothetical protein n=1 Tax=Actinopolyspora halophila TaxID=1850 RepID=UPI00036D3ED3|nr:hypothetical protein [Actinopolyspora halophila]
MDAVTNTLAALLNVADEHDEAIIRRRARQARLLWACRCRQDNPRWWHTCDGCGSALDDVCTPGVLDATDGSRGVSHHHRCDAVNQDGYHCTRTAGHLGRQHVAGNGRAVLAVWDWHHAVEVSTPEGAAMLTVVHIERSVDCTPTSQLITLGDRAVVCSRVDGDTDRYTVFERAHGRHHRWHPVATNLLAAELPDWHTHHTSSSATKPAWFEAWLDSIARAESHPSSTSEGPAH